MTGDIDGGGQDNVEPVAQPPSSAAQSIRVAGVRVAQRRSERQSKRLIRRRSRNADWLTSLAGFAAVATIAGVAATSLLPRAGSYPVQSPVGVAPAQSLPAARITSENGLIMTAQLQRETVPPGGQVVIDVTVNNSRGEAVEFGVDSCGAAATMSAELAPPFVPFGREWTGISDAFKRYALMSGLRSGGLPASQPVTVLATSGQCAGSSGVSGSDAPRILGPGKSVTASLTWSAEIIPGVPALPADVPFVVTFAHDPAGGPPSYPPDYSGPRGSWYRSYEQLEIRGVLSIAGTSPRTLSAGEALDVLLADVRFANWLAEQPARSWNVANIFLINVGDAQGIIPSGPLWEIDLFREVGVPRNWAIGFVDPFSAELRSLTLCSDPCDR